jgi:hypothetical protein
MLQITNCFRMRILLCNIGPTRASGWRPTPRRLRLEPPRLRKGAGGPRSTSGDLARPPLTNQTPEGNYYFFNYCENLALCLYVMPAALLKSRSKSGDLARPPLTNETP